jgi:hypothetical protein
MNKDFLEIPTGLSDDSSRKTRHFFPLTQKFGHSFFESNPKSANLFRGMCQQFAITAEYYIFAIGAPPRFARNIRNSLYAPKYLVGGKAMHNYT